MIRLVGWGLLDAPLPRRKRPYCNARKGNELPPPEERPEYRQVARAAAGLKSRLRKGLRLALRFRDDRMPSQQSRHCTHWSCSVPKSMR